MALTECKAQNLVSLEQLVRAATLAPSGDNLQPWQFEMDPIHQRLVVRLDSTADQSPMNVEQRMSRISLGAAVENILQTARASAVNCEYEIDEKATNVTLTLSRLTQTIQIPPSIQEAQPIAVFIFVDPFLVRSLRNFPKRDPTSKILRSTGLPTDQLSPAWQTSLRHLIVFCSIMQR